MKNFVESNIENMKRELGELVSYASVYSEDEKPFGSENRKVLDHCLKLMEEKGLKTTNLDYYCGYGEVGQGDQTIGILCHLDVVPAGDGWVSDPFEMVEKDGFVYGRGVSDDKCASVGAMYALKYLMDTGYEFKKKIRLIVGCNEESGSRCLDYYVEKEGHVDMGFTPDGGFPGVFAEKGMVSGTIKAKSSKILSLKGGLAGNIVCKEVSAEVENGSFDPTLFTKFMVDHKIAFNMKEEETTKITVFGVAAHASIPDAGVNALNHLLEGLYVAEMDDEFVRVFHNCIGLDVHGEKMGFEELSDEISNTSINLGVVSETDGEISISLDMRFPVKTSSDKCLKKLEMLNDGPVCFVYRGGKEPLYFDTEAPMIKAMMKAYQDVTGDYESQMEAIGGGTYAKEIHNCIAFGCSFPGDDSHMHGANESLSIENFKKQVLIYIEAIKNLCEI